MTMFRLKLNYQAVNDATGAMEKRKEELLVECMNYSDAESTLCKIVELYGLDKMQEVTYEIVKCKFNHLDIFYNDLLDQDYNVPLICGLTECFFREEGTGLYAVDVEIQEGTDEKPKIVKETYYIPATDPADATSRTMNIFKYKNYQASDCTVKNVKYDNTINIYLEPESLQTLLNRNNNINGL